MGTYSGGVLGWDSLHAFFWVWLPSSCCHKLLPNRVSVISTLYPRAVVLESKHTSCALIVYSLLYWIV